MGWRKYDYMLLRIQYAALYFVFIPSLSFFTMLLLIFFFLFLFEHWYCVIRCVYIKQVSLVCVCKSSKGRV